MCTQDQADYQSFSSGKLTVAQATQAQFYPAGSEMASKNVYITDISRLAAAQCHSLVHGFYH